MKLRRTPLSPRAQIRWPAMTAVAGGGGKAAQRVATVVTGAVALAHETG
jgi:hypothetical protein